MSAWRRAALVSAAPVVLVAFVIAAYTQLRGVRPCMSISCGKNYDPGGANVFGYELLTPAQSIVIALGIWLAAAVLGRGILPGRARWSSFGFGILALAAVVSLTLPSSVIGPPPSVPCSTPAAGGAVTGRCVTGSSPIDPRWADRAGVASIGLLAFGIAVLVDRRRSSRDPARMGTRPGSN
jgi:hypothetical protein